MNTTTAFMNYTANFGSEYNHSFYELYSGSYDGLEQGRPEFQPVVTLSHHDILILCYTCMTSTPTHQNKCTITEQTSPWPGLCQVIFRVLKLVSYMEEVSQHADRWPARTSRLHQNVVMCCIVMWELSSALNKPPA